MLPTDAEPPLDAVANAAGGILWRPSREGGAEFLVVHRDRYGDWTLPKGKIDVGETPIAAALREVKEETGLHAVPTDRLDDISYLVGTQTKTVSFWLMRPFGGRFEANEEVDECRWAPAEELATLLTYPGDRSLVAALPDLSDRGFVALTRHADAGNRATWTGPDGIRPLNRRGRRQATALVDQLNELRPTRILSSSYLRCVQTVAEIADAEGLEVEIHDGLTEGASWEQTSAMLGDLAGQIAVCSSHGDVIPRALTYLDLAGVALHGERACAKASTWLVETSEGAPRQAWYLPPPST